MGVKKFLGIWRIFLSKNIQSKMVYKADFIMGVLGNLFLQCLGFFTIWVIFNQVDTFAGWGYYEVLFMYGLAAIPNGLSEFLADGVWDIGHRYIRGGELDRLMTRPMNPLLSIMAAYMEPHGLGSVLFGIGVVVVSGAHCRVNWTAASILYVMLVAVCGALIYLSINLFVATFAFFFGKVTSTMVLIHHVNSFSKYPIEIYHQVIQILVTFIIPFAFTSYYPAAFLLEKTSWFMGIAVIFVSFLCMTFAYRFWCWGLKHYQSAGG